MFIIIVFWLGSDRPPGLLVCFVPAFILSKMYILGGKTDSEILWWKKNSVTSPRGKAEAGC